MSVEVGVYIFSIISLSGFISTILAIFVSAVLLVVLKLLDGSVAASESEEDSRLLLHQNTGPILVCPNFGRLT